MSLKNSVQGYSGEIIIANWKMNLSIPEALDFIKRLKAGKKKVIVAAPFVFLPDISKAIKSKGVFLSGQNVAQFAFGPYTGEVSAKMLKQVGCKYCLVGHSERRLYFKETDAEINQKILQLLKNKITPILCLGESAAERKKNLTAKVLKSQLLGALKNIKNAQNLLIAYEPIWAISTFQTGKIAPASPKDIIAAHSLIRRILKDHFKAGSLLPKVIYGGTVNPQNSRQILSLPEVAGALIGKASLKVSDFNAILNSI